MIETTFVGNNTLIRHDRPRLKNISYLLEIIVLVFPNKNERNPLKSIDERKEEGVNEVVVVSGVEVVDVGHEINQNLAELVLTTGIDASSLEKVQEQFHAFATIFDENAC